MQDYRGYMRGKVDEKAEIFTQGGRLTLACFSGGLGADIYLIYNKKQKRTELHFYVTSGSEYKRKFRSLGVYYLNETGKITKG